MAQTDCEETVNASFARALYLNPDAGLAPVSGHYDTGTTVLIVPKTVRLVGQDGKVQEQELPGWPRHNAQALSRYLNPARVRSISLLLEIRPLDYDGDAEQQWVDTDLLVRRYGDHAVATLSDQFTGDARNPDQPPGPYVKAIHQPKVYGAVGTTLEMRRKRPPGPRRRRRGIPNGARYHGQKIPA